MFTLCKKLVLGNEKGVEENVLFEKRNMGSVAVPDHDDLTCGM